MTFKKARTDTIQVSLSHVHTRKTCVCGTCTSCEVSVLFTHHQAPPLPSVKLVFIPFHTPLVVTSLAHTGRAKFTTLVHHVLGEGPALFIFFPTLPVTSETDFVRLQTAHLGGPRASLHLILVDIHLLRHAARTLACPRFMFFSLCGSCSCVSDDSLRVTSFLFCCLRFQHSMGHPSMGPRLLPRPKPTPATSKSLHSCAEG